MTDVYFLITEKRLHVFEFSTNTKPTILALHFKNTNYIELILTSLLVLKEFTKTLLYNNTSALQFLNSGVLSKFLMKVGFFSCGNPGLII